MPRTYDVEGTKSYFWAAIILAVLSAWHLVDGWVPQERWLAKYPEFPEHWLDFRLYDFYAYNRWTAMILGISSVVCAYIHRLVK